MSAPTSRTIAASFGKDPNNVGAPLDLGVDAFERVRRFELRSVRFRKMHECQHVVTGVVEHDCELGELRAELVRNDRPLLSSRLDALLRKDGVDERENDLPLVLAGVGERVAHEVDAAALPRRFEHFRDRRFKPAMRVGDDAFRATQTAPRQTAQKVRPERLRFAWANRKAQNLAYAIRIYADGYCYRNGKRSGRLGVPSRTSHRSRDTASRLRSFDSGTRRPARRSRRTAARPGFLRSLTCPSP